MQTGPKGQDDTLQRGASQASLLFPYNQYPVPPVPLLVFGRPTFPLIRWGWTSERLELLWAERDRRKVFYFRGSIDEDFTSSAFLVLACFCQILLFCWRYVLSCAGPDSDEAEYFQEPSDFCCDAFVASNLLHRARTKYNMAQHCGDNNVFSDLPECVSRWHRPIHTQNMLRGFTKPSHHLHGADLCLHRKRWRELKKAERRITDDFW